MLKSLYSGVSGMRGFQTKMDVIANNIANVNTTAFKSGRARFQDMLSQTIAGAQGATEGGMGGINAQQTGLGVKVGAIDTIMTGGGLQPTNRELDLAIEGEGFFIVSPDEGETKYYTRDGAFFKDGEGYLVNSNGEKLWSTDDSSIMIEDQANFSIDRLGNVTIISEDGEPEIFATLAMARFNNPEGLEKVGNNNYANTSNTGELDEREEGDTGFGMIRQGFLEMSNVDLANEFTEMIIASKAYSANSRSISTSDEMLQELINLKR